MTIKIINFINVHSLLSLQKIFKIVKTLYNHAVYIKVRNKVVPVPNHHAKKA